MILHKHGVKLKKTKIVCFSESMTYYFAFQINKQVVFPGKAKFEDTLNTKSLENVTQLKSFLGMTNYYRRHLPILAGVLEPLHNLLRKMLSGRPEKKQF